MAEELRINIIGDASKLTGAMGQAGSQVDKFAEKIGKVGKTMTIVGGIVTAALGMIVKKTMDVGDQFDKMSLRTGVAVEDLSTLAYAADICGSDIGTVEKGLKGLAKGLADAEKGVGLAKDAFEYLDIAVTDTEGNLRPTVEVLKEAATKIAAIEDPTRQAALAMDIFGAKAGPALLPLLKQGGAGIDELMQKARDLNLEISTESAAASAKLKDTMLDLKESVGSLGRGIGEILIPPLTELAEKAVEMIKKIKEWADAHKPLVERIVKVGATLGVLAAVGGPILIAVSALMKMKGVIIAVSSMMKLLPALFTKISLALSPLTIQIGLIAANLYIWIEVWKEYQKIMNSTRVTTEDVEAAQNQLREVQEELAAKLGITIEKLIEFQEAGALISEMLGEDLNEVNISFEDILESVNKMAEIGNILQPAEEAIKKIIDAFTPYEKQLAAINERYDEAIERIKIYIKGEEELKDAIDTLNEGRKAEITLLDRQKTALEKVSEAKKRLADLTKSLTDKIYEFTHTEEEVKLRDINQEYDLLIETAKEVLESKSELINAIKIINEKRQEEIDALKESNKLKKEATEDNKDLKESYEDLGEGIEKATETTVKLGVLGGESWEGLTVQIKLATASLSNFTKEGIAAAITQIKMKFLPAILSTIETINTGIGLGRKMAEYQLAELRKNMQEQINLVMYAYEEYQKILASMGATSGGTASFVIPSYKTGIPYVPRTGLAVVHVGEEINPPGQRSYDQRKYSNVVNIYNPIVRSDDDINKIERSIKGILDRDSQERLRQGNEIMLGV